MTTSPTFFYEQPFLSVDTETTGIDPFEERIVTVSMVANYPEEDRKDVVKSWLINPGVDIPEGATQIHGISNEMAQANGVSPQEALPEVAKALLKWEANALPLIIFNAQFDATIFREEFARHGVAFDGTFRYTVDPYVLDKHYSYRKGKRTLEAMAPVYDVTLENAHDATFDAIAAAHIVRAIGRKYQVNHTSDDLFTFQQNAKKKQSLSLQDYFRKTDPEKLIPTGWPYRTRKSDAADALRSPVQPALDVR